MDMRQAILKQLEKKGWTINHFATQVQDRVPRRTVYAYLRGEEDSLSRTVAILLEAAGLRITTTRAKRPRKEQKK